MKLELRPYPPFVEKDVHACKDADPEIFYPVRYRETAMTRARKICDSCPVMMECAAWAIETREPDGVWGGFSPHERSEVWNQRK